jgi:hypothetical protein
LPANVEVLAKDATEVASGKEDGPGTLPAAQAIFLTMMRKVA